MILDRLLTLVANLLPLAGVWWWGWDVFQVLILYWLQTVLVVAFSLLHIRKLPEAALGDIKVNGRSRPSTHRDLVRLFALIGFVFCAAHLLFLWVFFSGDWSKVVRGPLSFWQTMVIESGAWLALLLNLIGSLARYLVTPPRSAFVRAIGARIGLADRSEPGGEIGTVFSALFKRIFVMQAAIIFGAMFAKSYGSMAPLMILIGLKTLIDLGGQTIAAAPQAITALRK